MCRRRRCIPWSRHSRLMISRTAGIMAAEEHLFFICVPVRRCIAHYIQYIHFKKCTKILLTDIENLTHKTGNYKQFDVFIAMLQSGLLKTSESVSLDLLTFEDLEHLRSRRRDGSPTSSASSINKNANRRYLILTYSVEFDRIHYPLPLEYCGPPDAAILQATIRRLEGEIERLQSTRGGSKELYKKIEQLTLMNKRLVEENTRLSNSGKGIRRLLVAVKCLESTVSQERTSFRTQIKKLRAENAALTMRLRQFTENSSMRASNSSPTIKKRMPLMPTLSRRSTARRSRSRSNSARSRMKAISLSPGSTSADSLRSGDSPQRESVRSHKLGGKVIDFGNLESRIHALQKMLQDGINLN